MNFFCKILKNIAASATKFKIIVAFNNRPDATMMRRKLIETVHLQPPTPTHLGNTKLCSFTQGELKENALKACVSNITRLNTGNNKNSSIFTGNQ